MENKIIKYKDDCNKCGKMKSEASTGTTSQVQTVVKQACVAMQCTKLHSPAYSLQSDIIKKAVVDRHRMCQKMVVATGTTQMQVTVGQVTPMFNNAKLHPLRCSAQPEVGRKKVEKTKPTDLVQIPCKQETARQVVAILNNPKLLSLKCSIMPDVRKKMVKSNVQADQREKSKVRVPLRPTEEEAKSVPNIIKQKQKMAWKRLPLPMSPEVALKHFFQSLTSLEQKEILDFPDIWYLGLWAERKRGEEIPVDSKQNSSVYDDAKFVYIPVLHDHIVYRYEILEKLGQGSFGLVLKCLDHKTKEQVALKIIHNQKSANRMALRELEILDVIRKEDSENCYNVIHMKEHMTFRNHICIVFELQGMDLYKLIRNNNFHGFTLFQTHHYAVALVTSLQMLHRKQIIHCDLKPENILLSEKKHGNIKLADFGCSFYEHQKGYTYVQTRFYRAPEVILGIPYGTAIDMWSLGCILAELNTGYPLFCGTNEVDQLACIMEVLGMPPDDIVQLAPRNKAFFDSEGQPKNLTRRPPNSRDLASVLKNVDSLFLDFMKRCLVWDPAERMTAEEAAQHPWLLKGKVPPHCHQDHEEPDAGAEN
ncbi:dual specificity tyrosine-phosphorylation-regulated kinase 4-like [Conger conger]|uniref:dual specificity tyrosine-phosphorylation-regulated kinase 4-like n=1 Tax=Conger conger TaxID=82655 RepID=UPI002A59EF0C|nr:dual specificity tyrosine-phosphorylation-regulated kinase 4-like [Conger conger]